jgi:hypothetical protein
VGGLEADDIFSAELLDERRLHGNLQDWTIPEPLGRDRGHCGKGRARHAPFQLPFKGKIKRITF